MNANTARHVVARCAQQTGEETIMIDTREENIKVLRAVPAIMRALTQDQDDATLRQRPSLGEWAAIEVIMHMADTDERALERIRRMRDEDEPYLPAFDPEALAVERAYISAPTEPALRRLEEVITTLVTELSALDDNGWARMGRQEAHGRVSIVTYFSHVAAEDVDHLAQIARLRKTS
jgi:hypothetical protein